jgi:transcriptional regulator with XRE-family HTH domain
LAEQAAFCELMIGARKATGLTQHALALRLKKPQSFVAKYEGGERRLDIVEFVTIARALGADPLKLMTTLLSGGKGKSPRAKRDT